MAKIPVKALCEKYPEYELNQNKVYKLIAKKPHLKVRVPGLGLLIDEEKFKKLIA